MWSLYSRIQVSARIRSPVQTSPSGVVMDLASAAVTRASQVCRTAWAEVPK
ncbi:MAG: hypothetical protein JO345_10135 [Streptosporangiaceae bacterium]|nr:hypothetical protein [Streptosporangiaceae bacterium]